MTLPYFFTWRNGGEFPDGGARLYQPVMLVQAFNLCSHVANKIEIEAAEKRNKK
jgi:hypothetical protein